MTGFVLRRILSSALVIVLTSMFVFVLFFVGMGDRPAENYCQKLGSARCTPVKLASIERDMGLDQSVVRNYREWVDGVFVGRKNVYMDGKFYDCPAPCLGISITSSQPVSTELEQRYPATLTLAIGGAAIYLTGGVILGVMAAQWRGRTTDRLIVGGTLAISSIPLYVIALLAWVYFTLKLPVFPNTGYYPITENPLKTISYMMLPWLVLGLTNLTGYARFTRGQMVETFDEDYMRTAQGKGPADASTTVQARAACLDRAGDHDLRPRLRHPAGRRGLRRADLRYQRHRLLGPAARSPSQPDRHQRRQRHRAGRRGA